MQVGAFTSTEACLLMAKNALELLATDPVELSLLSLKTKMMMILSMVINDSGRNQADIALMLGVSQPRVSNLMRGKISKFSIDMLIEMLGKMGYMLDVSFDPTSKETPISAYIKKSAV